MSTADLSLLLPNYDTFVDAISILALPFSASELHGIMCGYLCAGALTKGEAYLRTLMTPAPNKELRLPTLALFGVYAVSQQQLSSFDFKFQLLLPDDDMPIRQRAEAFSDWCNGFTQGFTQAGIDEMDLQDEEAQDALDHLIEFAQLDCNDFQIDEQDEIALMEVSEFARMAVMHIYADLQTNHRHGTPPDVAH